MTEHTLVAKIYNSRQMKQMSEVLADLIGDLSVEVDVKGTLAGKWVQIEVSGEDETVATRLLERDIGFCPVSLENVKKFDILKGYVSGLEKSGDVLLVDLGIIQPRPTFASIPLKHLQSKLASGKDFSLKRTSELWGICENRPLEIKVLETGSEENLIKAELATAQIHKFEQWRDSLLDRLIIIGAPIQEVSAAIEQERLNRDVINVEALGVFEHALVCKLGTDAAGLIGRIGRRLRKARFTIFDPKKALALVDSAPNKA